MDEDLKKVINEVIDDFFKSPEANKLLEPKPTTSPKEKEES